MMQYLEEARNFFLSRCRAFPEIAITLGSGLGSILDELNVEVELPFQEIPHFKTATVTGHSGKVLIGKLGEKRVVCLQGRLHYYEGYSLPEVVFPFRALALAGVKSFVLTNAAGGVQPDMKAGDLLLIRDHLNLMGSNPLVGKNDDRLGERFPDMSAIYDEALRKTFLSVSKKLGMTVREGVYAGVHGPSYETPAEVKMLRLLGADVIGMSTVPEAIALHHMGRKVVAVSCITNLAAGVGKGILDHQEVLTVAKQIQKSFSALVKEFIHVI